MLPVFMSWRDISLSVGQENLHFGFSQYTVRLGMHHQMQGAPPDNQAEPHWGATSPVALILSLSIQLLAVRKAALCIFGRDSWWCWLAKLFTVCMTWFADPMQVWSTFLWAFCHSSGREVDVLIFAGGVSRILGYLA